MMNAWPIEIGSVVISKAGRDRGRRFLVVGVVDDDFVMVANGALRKMNRQKKKRRKHLKPTGRVATALRERLSQGKPAFSWLCVPRGPRARHLQIPHQ